MVLLIEEFSPYLISLYISYKAIDIVLSGRPTFKMVHISTKEYDI